MDRKEEFSRLSELAQKHAEQLLEHCDAVQIFVQKTADDGSGDTLSAVRGGGPWLARYGHVVMWLKEVDAAEASKMQNQDDED